MPGLLIRTQGRFVAAAAGDETVSKVLHKQGPPPSGETKKTALLVASNPAGKLFDLVPVDWNPSNLVQFVFLAHPMVGQHP